MFCKICPNVYIVEEKINEKEVFIGERIVHSSSLELGSEVRPLREGA